MVYSVKCDECGKLAEFGDEKDLRDNKVGKLDDYIEFDDRILCKECVKKFVRFGVGDLEAKVNNLERMLEEIGKDAGVDVGSIKDSYDLGNL